MKSTFLTTLFFISTTIYAQNKIPNTVWEIETAVMALPEEHRSEAKVYGYDSNSELQILREGTNQYICIADNPKKEGFETAAYHQSLDNFMARGRELKIQGKGFKEIFDIREKEVKSGKLKMPDKTILYVFSGDVNPQTNEIENEYVRYVIYIPYATVESTGLPASPKAAGHPWIMNPGTHRAHIMITPPLVKKE